MAKLKKAPRTSSTAGSAPATPAKSHSAPSASTSAAPSPAASTSRRSAPIPLRSAAHLSAPVTLSESVVAALDDVAGSPSSGVLSAHQSSTESPSAPSSPRFYRTRIASSSTVASQETLSTQSASPGSGSALAKLRSRLDLDQAAREQATATAAAEGGGPHPAKLRKRSHRPLSTEEAARLAESPQDHTGGDLAEAQNLHDHDHAPDHDPPEWALEPAAPESAGLEPFCPGDAGIEAIPPVSVQLPEPVTLLAEPLPREPEPSASPSSSALSVLFAPVRLGWRVATAPARLSYRAASLGVGVVESGIAFGQTVAQVGITTAVVDAGSNVPLVGGVVSAVSERVGLVTIRPDKAALQISLGVALAATLVARAVLNLAFETVRGSASNRHK
ncbi:hypothetical protein JCM3774_002053 [Rhodotorula dairenensis]